MLQKICFLVLLISSTLFCFSQKRKISKAENEIGVSDSIVKQQVAYKDPGAAGHNINWDFASANTINEEYVLKYFLPNKKKSELICGQEHDTRYYYLFKNDSLWLSGYENPTTYIQYLKPELRLKFPFAYGDTLYSKFGGKGQYCHRTNFDIAGQAFVKVDADGEMTLPDGSKHKNVLRVKTLRKYSETGKDSLSMTVEQYAWYALGSRYPIFESILSSVKKGKKDDSTFYTTSFYYPPQKQKLQMLKEETTLVSNAEESNTSTDATDITSVFTEAKIMPNPVIDDLNISFKLTRQANVWFSIQSNGGIIINQSNPSAYSEGYHELKLSMSNQLTGVYALYVHVDDMMLKRNIVKR